jgi:ADP-heptose:LPS heptosyltransferase
VVTHLTTSLGRRVVVTGSRPERELVAEVVRRSGGGGMVWGCEPRDVVELAAVVAHASVVVCPDTGVAHLATAFRTPSVLLFGPSSPARWGPPPDRPWHRVIWHGREGDAFAGSLDPGLDAVTVDEVVAELEAVLSGIPNTQPSWTQVHYE